MKSAYGMAGLLAFLGVLFGLQFFSNIAQDKDSTGILYVLFTCLGAMAVVVWQGQKHGDK